MQGTSINGQKVELDIVKQGLKDRYERNQHGPLKLGDKWQETIHGLLKTLPEEQLFPVLDILRLLVLDEKVREWYIKEDTGEIVALRGELRRYARDSLFLLYGFLHIEKVLLNILYRFGGQQAQPETVPKSVRLMVLRLVSHQATVLCGCTIVSL